MKMTVRPAVVWFTATLFLAVGLLAQWREVSLLKEEVLRLEQARSQPPEPRQPEEVKAPTPAEITRTVARPTELEELRQVRAELLNLQRRLQQLEAVASENESLRKELAAARESLTNGTPQAGAIVSNNRNPASIQLRPDVTLTDSPGTTLQDKVEAILCANHLDQISIAADLWAANHNGFGPSNLVELRGYLAPMILVCPGAHLKSIAADWRTFDVSTITYLLRSPGVEWKGADRKFVDCPIHQTIALNGPHETGIPGRFVK
jgi:hypothetical protein